jgi:hypothetical protein
MVTEQLVANETTLRRIREACVEATGVPDYAGPVPVSKLSGFCVHVAQTVVDIFGGVIVRGRFNGLPHWWNRLPDGREVDLTSCQFGGDGLRPVAKGRRARAGGDGRPEVAAFSFCVRAALGLVEG